MLSHLTYRLENIRLLYLLTIRYKLLKIEYKLLDIEYKLLKIGHKLLTIGYKLLTIGYGHLNLKAIRSPVLRSCKNDLRELLIS